MATLKPLSILAAAAWFALAAPMAHAAPKVFPEREFPAQTAEEKPLAEAYFKADDAQDLPATEAAAAAWLAYHERTSAKDAWFKAFILERLALAQGQQGKHAEALASFQRAYDLYAKAFGADAPETRDVGMMLAVAQFKLERFAQARATIIAVSKNADAADGPDSDKALAALRAWGQIVGNSDYHSEAADVWGEYAARRLRRFGEADAEYAIAEVEQGSNLVQSERAAEAFQILARAVQRAEKATGASSKETLTAQAWEVQAMFGAGRFKDSEAQSKSLMDTSRKALGPKADSTLLAEETYFRSLLAQGAYDRAPAAFQTLLQGRIKTFGENDAATLDMVELGADLYESMARYDAAEPLRRLALDASIKMTGPTSERTLVRVNNLADLLTRDDRAAEAEALLAPIWARIGPTAESEIALETGSELSIVYVYQERYADAETLLRNLSSRVAHTTGIGKTLALNINGNLGVVIGRRGRMVEAEALHRETWAGWKALKGPSHPRTVMAGLQVARSITAPERLQERQQLIIELEKTLSDAGQTSAANPTYVSILKTIGEEMMRLGAYKSAEEVWGSLRQAYLPMFGKDNATVRLATETLARAKGLQDKHAEAEPLFAELVQTEERLAGPGGERSSAWISAEAGLGLSRTMQGRARDGYPALQNAAAAVYARSANRRITGTGSEERRRVLLDNRYVFNALLRSGWAFAHES
jgi:hypothetical protein